MRLLIVDQTPLDEASRMLLKANFSAEDTPALAQPSELLQPYDDPGSPGSTPVPFVLLTPMNRILLSEPASRSLLPSIVIVTEHVPENAHLYEPFFSAGILDLLLVPLPPTYLNAKMRILLNRARVRTVRDVIRLINRLSQKTLTQTELAFLRTIISKGESGASREQLQTAAWGHSPVATNRSLDTHLFNLRRKIEDLKIDIQYRRIDKRWTLISSNPAIKIPKSMIT